MEQFDEACRLYRTLDPLDDIAAERIVNQIAALASFSSSSSSSFKESTFATFDPEQIVKQLEKNNAKAAKALLQLPEYYYNSACYAMARGDLSSARALLVKARGAIFSFGLIRDHRYPLGSHVFV